jgi:hypothetical protein
MQDWPLMCKVLLEEDEENGITEDQKQTLVKILAASLALTPREEVPKDKKKKKVRPRAQGARVCIYVHIKTYIIIIIVI